MADDDDVPLSFLVSAPPPAAPKKVKTSSSSSSAAPPKVGPSSSSSSTSAAAASTSASAADDEYKRKLKEIRRFEKEKALGLQQQPGSKKKRDSSSNNDDNNEDDFEPKKKSKPSASSSSSSSSSSSRPKAVKSENGGSAKGGTADKELKSQDKSERISQGLKAFLWWESPPLSLGHHWVSMEHVGVAFPPLYARHGQPLLYDGKEVALDDREEERATLFADMDPNGMHLGNVKTAAIFEANFFEDFKKVLSPANKALIKDFSKLDFSKIRSHFNIVKLVSASKTSAEKNARADVKEAVQFRHGYALVDGHVEKVGNFNMEPPGTFRGRGEHPKMGKVKSRVHSEGVQINLSEGAAVPQVHGHPGHAWGSVQHDPEVQWLASWMDNVNDSNKYMALAAASSFKGKSDRSKYNKAARLIGHIDEIRKDYGKNLKSKERTLRELATAMWVIDKLALRVGGEKDTEEEADTVGCCSLRVEHLHFNPEGKENAIELEFLGKDSMLFKQTIDFGATQYTEAGGMGLQVFENFKGFAAGKAPADDVFTDLTPTILNKHLTALMPGLSAKVFRTYNASITLQSELAKIEAKPGWATLDRAKCLIEYNNANRIVAILCNHQKTVSAAAAGVLKENSDRLETLREQKKVLKGIFKILSQPDRSNDKKIPKKEEDSDALKAEKDKIVKETKELRENAKTSEEKIAAGAADKAAAKTKKEIDTRRFADAHLWPGVPTLMQVTERLKLWSEKVAKAELDFENKNDNKEVALGTSKTNYMDPRVTVAFCKRNELPIDKYFPKTLRDKFNWAMSVPPDWKFDKSVGDVKDEE